MKRQKTKDKSKKTRVQMFQCVSFQSIGVSRFRVHEKIKDKAKKDKSPDVSEFQSFMERQKTKVKRQEF
jgi:hypothetical protein